MQINRIAHSKCEFALASIALFAISIAAVFFYSSFSLNHDSSWYLVATDRFLDGAKLYSDILEINPPLAFYLTIPPVAAARFLDSDPTLAYFIYCISLGFLSALWSLFLLERSGLSKPQKSGFFFAVVAALIFVPMPDFGQREHLLLLFAMPFLLSQIVLTDKERPTAPHQVVLGLVASLGFLLKPYFLIIPAMIGLVRIWQQRNLQVFRDAGYLAIAVAAVIYLAFIVQFHSAYIELIVPMAAEVYSSYGIEAKRVLLRPEIFAFGLVLGAVWRGSCGASKQAQRFLAACAASAIVYLVQFKGWNYHLLPLSAFVFLTAVWLLLHNWRYLRRDVLLATSLGVAVLTTLGLQIARGPYESRTTAYFSRFLTGEGQSILVLSTNVWAAFPFVNEVSGRWASSYPAQWLIPGAYTKLKSDSCAGIESPCKKAQEILRFSRRAIVDDLERFQPELIYVDERARKSYFGSQEFDYFTFLSEDARFEKMRACYERLGEAGSYGVFKKTCQKRGA